jgi:hypothetical protein
MRALRFLGIITLCSLVAPMRSSGAGELSLNARSDLDSAFYEYFSAGFVRMDQFSSTNPTFQNFHDINNPAVEYGKGFDGFPNDRNFRLGHVTYDEGGLVGGTGVAPITGVTLGITLDPSDGTYENWRRFSTVTVVDLFEGAVNVVDGAPVSAVLDASVTLQVSNVFGSTVIGEYQGTFSLEGARFEFQAEGNPVFDTIWGTGPVHLKWDFSGRLTALPAYLGDYNDDGAADGADFLLWQRELGGSVTPPGSGADGDSSGMVDGGDLAIWQANFGQSNAAGAPASAVPEPTTLWSAGAGGALLAAQRRRGVRGKKL